MLKQLVNCSDTKKEELMEEGLAASKIRIKPENKGKFTQYCKDAGYTGVTEKCIKEGKKSKSKAVRKRAVFAENAKEWSK